MPADDRRPEPPDRLRARSVVCARLRRRRPLPLLGLLLGLLVALALPLLEPSLSSAAIQAASFPSAPAAPSGSAAAMSGSAAVASNPVGPFAGDVGPGRPARPTAIVPIERQPFYPELLRIAAAWQSNELGEVVADSPRETLLNFYAVMTQVQHGIELLRQQGTHPPRLLWPAADRVRIAEIERLFSLAVQSLDASGFPASIREDSADEAALQLKELLDHVFSHSTVPIRIPDAAELKRINSERGSPGDGWTLPGTAITLAGHRQPGSGRLQTRFSADSVQQIARMYEQIRGQPVIAQPFATPGFYEAFALSPGYLVPPRWYLSLPSGLRRLLQAQTPLRDQSVLQVGLSLFALVSYIVLCLLIVRSLLRSYVQRSDLSAASRREPGLWEQDNLAWRRAGLLLLLVLLTALTSQLLDDNIGLTGSVLVASKVIFAIIFFLALSLLAFLVSEAIGRSFSESLLWLRADRSELQLRRISNLVMPVSRVLGAVVSLLLVYRLLHELGLPSSMVLAFSAVPGLAIGLGASKLLGNLFAGLAIQTDRPLRVGEFCRVGGNLGFVTRIGLRSLEIQTLESRVTIPNAIADEEMVVNYSRHEGFQKHHLSQTIELRLAVEDDFTPVQLRHLLSLLQHRLGDWQDLHGLRTSLEPAAGQGLTLLCLATVACTNWHDFLAVRNRLLLRLNELIDQVRRSRRIVGIRQASGEQQRDRIASLVADVAASIPDLSVESCLLLAISDDGYDYEVMLSSLHRDHAGFRAAIDRFNRDLMTRFDAEAIELSMPLVGVHAVDGIGVVGVVPGAASTGSGHVSSVDQSR